MLSAISDSDAKGSESNGLTDPVANGSLVSSSNWFPSESNGFVESELNGSVGAEPNGSVGFEANGSVGFEPNGSVGFEPNGSSEPDVSAPNMSSSNSDLNGSS